MEEDELYELLSGYLIIDKKLFLKDLLSKKSDLRPLLNSSESRFIEPIIEKTVDSVKIIFDEATNIDMDEHYKDFFQKLKTKYKNKIKGRVVVRVTCYATFSSIIDFDKEEHMVLVY